MGKTTWSGPIRTGRRNAPANNTYGHILASQQVGVSGVAGAGTHTHTFASELPSCNIVGIQANIESSFAATAAAIVHFKIGTTAAASAFGTFAVLGAGVYDFGVVGATPLVEAAASAMVNWVGVAEGTQLMVTVSAPVTAAVSSRGIVYVTYYQNSAATV